MSSITVTLKEYSPSALALIKACTDQVVGPLRCGRIRWPAVIHFRKG